MPAQSRGSLAWEIEVGYPSQAHRDTRAVDTKSVAAAWQAPGGGREEEEARRKRARGAEKKLPTVSLTLVSFAVTRKAYEKITARFAKEYEAATGQPVRFRLSFGGSGTQARRDPPDPDPHHMPAPPVASAALTRTLLTARACIACHRQVHQSTPAEHGGESSAALNPPSLHLLPRL